MEEQIQSPERFHGFAAENPSEPPEIPTLTRRMAEGDEMAWRTFHNSYFDRLWRYLLVVSGGNEDVSREALQATFVRVARHIKTFADETMFWNWLTVLARSAFGDEKKNDAVISRFWPVSHSMPMRRPAPVNAAPRSA